MTKNNKYLNKQKINDLIIRTRRNENASEENGRIIVGLHHLQMKLSKWATSEY